MVHEWAECGRTEWRAAPTSVWKERYKPSKHRGSRSEDLPIIKQECQPLDSSEEGLARNRVGRDAVGSSDRLF